MRVDFYGRGQVKIFEIRGGRKLIIKLLNGLRLILDVFVKIEGIIGGLVLKILKSKVVWLGGLYMVGWIDEF